MVKLLLPQEVETFYIIPTLRKYFAKFMKEDGLKQKDIAQLLGVNTAAVSQYISEKRGNQIDFPKEIKEEIKKSAKKIDSHLTYMREMQHMLKVIRISKTICDIHKKFSTVPQGCTPENVGCSNKKLVECR